MHLYIVATILNTKVCFYELNLFYFYFQKVFILLLYIDYIDIQVEKRFLKIYHTYIIIVGIYYYLFIYHTVQKTRNN